MPELVGDPIFGVTIFEFEGKGEVDFFRDLNSHYSSWSDEDQFEFSNNRPYDEKLTIKFIE